MSGPRPLFFLFHGALPKEHRDLKASPMKHIWGILAMCAIFAVVIFLWRYDNIDTVRLITVWTARLVLPPFIVGFIYSGWRQEAVVQRIACRIAAFAMTIHALSIIRLSYLAGEAPLSFRTPMEWLVSIGGAAALGLVLAGWPFGDQPWYRWAMYWPMGVFIFTYVILSRYSETIPRIFANPLYFGPVLALLLVAFGWRVFVDYKTIKTKLSERSRKVATR
jgi:hypothetical protein